MNFNEESLVIDWCFNCALTAYPEKGDSFHKMFAYIFIEFARKNLTKGIDMLTCVGHGESGKYIRTFRLRIFRDTLDSFAELGCIEEEAYQIDNYKFLKPLIQESVDGKIVDFKTSMDPVGLYIEVTTEEEL